MSTVLTEYTAHLGGPKGLALGCSPCGNWHFLVAPEGIAAGSVLRVCDLFSKKDTRNRDIHPGWVRIDPLPYRTTWRVGYSSGISAQYAYDMTHQTD